MGCKHFEFRVHTLLLLTLLCRSSITNAAQYVDPDNYDNLNNVYTDYNNHGYDYGSEKTGGYDTAVNGKPRNVDIEHLSAKNGEDEEDQVTKNDCWLTLSAAAYFKAMDNLDEQFKTVRENYQLNVGKEMDGQMLDALLSSRGAAPRTIQKFRWDSQQIPAGLNLGGYSLMRLKDSILFFHRMKLRNSTHFQVHYLHNDLENMALVLRLGLNDLHLEGAYERSATHTDPSVLYYRPSFGKLEILMKNVNYKMEGRMRLLSDRLTIELLTSELLITDDILMSYLNTNITSTPEYTIRVQKRSLEDFLERLKSDLDMWLKDYFNDFLIYYQLPTNYDHTEIQEYEKNKTIYLNEYVNYSVNTIRQKIYLLGGHSLKMPQFTIFSVPNMVLKIKEGVLRGMDSMYQRSVATGKKENKIRSVDVIIGFSKLKVEYKFEAVLPNGSPPLTGYLFLSADELTAHMAITLIKEPEAIDLSFDFIRHLKPESLVVEGPANRLVANYKHLLSHQIVSLMTNAMLHNVKMLNTITRCVPFIYGKPEPYIISRETMEVDDQGQKMTKSEERESGTLEEMN